MKDHTTAAMYNAALEYIRQGWHVLQLHGVDANGNCTCGKRPCHSAGKHPVQRGWTESHKPSTNDAWALWVEDDTEWNVGIVTGATSGFFALDIDPKDGGYETLAAWEEEHGELPKTYTVTTGSGGRHYYFSLPDFEIRNSAKKLGEGVDVRGNGGQVVAPPSVSDAGPYSVQLSAPICAAPKWLLDLLTASPTYDTADVMPVENLPVYSDLDSFTQHRVQRYAEVALEKEVERYTNAPSGTGNHQLFVTACKLIELAQSTWNLLTVDQVKDALNEGRIQRCFNSTNGGQSADEFQKTFKSAMNNVVGQGREMPEGRETPQFQEFILPAPEGVTPGKDEPGGDSEERAAARAAWLEGEILREIHRQKIYEEAKKRREHGAESDPRSLEARAQALIDQMLSSDDLDDLPSPEPLVEGLLDLDSESWIIAEPGGFKSFVVLDIAGHVGRGMDWQTRKVTQGEVVYIVAEGAKGIRLRKKAWEKVYGPMKNVRFLAAPVQVADKSAWEALVEACRIINPVMIILDTQARITVGLDENSAAHMGELVEAVRQLRAATGACILTVHHIGRNGKDARGSSALDGAQDTELRITRGTSKADRKSMRATITLDKQKDGDESCEVLIQLEIQDLGEHPTTGLKMTSLAIMPYSFMSLEKTVPPWISELSDTKRAVLDAMDEHMEVDLDDGRRQFGMTFTQILSFVGDRATQMSRPKPSRTAVNRALGELKESENKGSTTSKTRMFVYQDSSGKKYYTEDPTQP